MVRKFPPFRSERKKRATSGGSLQFSNRFSGKITVPFDFQPKFPVREFLLNGKHPSSSEQAPPTKRPLVIVLAIYRQYSFNLLCVDTSPVPTLFLIPSKGCLLTYRRLNFNL